MLNGEQNTRPMLSNELKNLKKLRKSLLADFKKPKKPLRLPRPNALPSRSLNLDKLLKSRT